MALDLSLDPNWCLYGFRRDGISCYQVNDLAGRVHIVVENADETFWVLLAGESMAKVLLLTQGPTLIPDIGLVSKVTG